MSIRGLTQRSRTVRVAPEIIAKLRAFCARESRNRAAHILKTAQVTIDRILTAGHLQPAAAERLSRAPSRPS